MHAVLVRTIFFFNGVIPYRSKSVRVPYKNFGCFLLPSFVSSKSFIFTILIPIWLSPVSSLVLGTVIHLQGFTVAIPGTCELPPLEFARVRFGLCFTY